MAVGTGSAKVLILGEREGDYPVSEVRSTWEETIGYRAMCILMVFGEMAALWDRSHAMAEISSPVPAVPLAMEH